MNTQSQRAGGLRNLLANVGNKSGKRERFMQNRVWVLILPKLSLNLQSI